MPPGVSGPVRYSGLTLLVFLVLWMAVNSALQQGLLALRDGKVAEARASFEQVLRDEPKNAVAWVSLAETCRRLRDAPAANAAAAKAEEFGMQVPAVEHALSSFYAQQQQFARAARLEERYAGSGKADAQAALRAAEYYGRAEEWENSERVLKVVWEKRTDDPVVAYRYAQVLLQRLAYAEAEKAVLPALAKHPNEEQLILLAGVTRYCLHRYDEAADDFLRVIALDPTIPQPYSFLLKMMEMARPKLPEIEKAIEARRKLAPDDAEANLLLAKVRLLNDSRDLTAEVMLRHSIAVDPNVWESHFELGVLLENKRDYKSALAELQKSVALDARQAVIHYHLARVYDRLGEPERAAAERKVHEELMGIGK